MHCYDLPPVPFSFIKFHAAPCNVVGAMIMMLYTWYKSSYMKRAYDCMLCKQVRVTYLSIYSIDHSYHGGKTRVSVCGIYIIPCGGLLRCETYILCAAIHIHVNIKDVYRYKRKATLSEYQSEQMLYIYRCQTYNSLWIHTYIYVCTLSIIFVKMN